MRERGDRLDRYADDDVLTVRDAALDPSGVVGPASPGAVSPGVLGEHDIVEGGAAVAGAGEAVADLDALEGVHAEDRLADPAGELAVPLDMRAEPEGHAGGARFDDAAERVAVALGRVDRVDHRVGGGGVGAAHG